MSNIPAFEYIKNHKLIGKSFKCNIDNFIFTVTGVKEASNGIILFSETSEHICQYYLSECKEISK